MLNNYICALDIGSSKIAGVLARTKRNRIVDISFETQASKGVKRGLITDSIDLSYGVASVLKNLKAKSGINIKFIYINISGLDIVTKHSRAIIPLADRGNKVITLSDIHKVNEQARILGLSLEEEIIHRIPLGYTIDSANNILNPLGLYSHRLEVDLYLVCSKLSSLQSLTRVVNQAGYEIKKLFLSGLATSKVVFNKELKEGLNIICDIGSDITEWLIFEDGLIKDLDILPVGGDDLTDRLQDTLKIPFDLAEDIKRSYGAVGDYTQIKEDKEILVKKGDVYKPIKQRLVCEIITSKAKLICKAIKDSVDKRIDVGRLNNFVTTGRTVMLEGFLEMLENILETPVKIGQITDPDIIPLANKEDVLSGQKYLNYITSLGIICEALGDRQTQTPHLNHPPTSPLLKIINRVKEVYQEYF